MEIILLSIAFMFLVLICGASLTTLAYIVYKNKADFNTTLANVNHQMNIAFSEFQNGIKTNQKLVEDLNSKLDEVSPAIASASTTDERIRSLENFVKLKTTTTHRITQ
jgi:uncharacterized protein YoxC